MATKIISGGQSTSPAFIKNLLLGSFVLLIVLFNSLGLAMVAVCESANTSLLFYAKEGIVPTLFMIMVLTTTRRRIDAVDHLAFILLAGTVVLTIINVEGPWMMAFRLRFYMFPLLLFITGKHFFKDLSDSSINKILTAVIILVIVLGYAYFFIFVSYPSLFLDANLHRLYEGQTGKSDIDLWLLGFKPNCFSYYGGHLIKRAFGPFFDPLMTGFFLAPLLHNSRYGLHHRKTLAEWITFLLLFVLLGLTQTRAIILGFVFACFAVRISRERLKVISTKLLALFIAGVVISLIYYYEQLTASADPSIRGHLAAYYATIGKFATAGVREYLIGWKTGPETSFGNESMFASMILHNGAIYFILFNAMIYTAFVKLRETAPSRLQFIALSSLVTYYLASFTTEHWFATTSCSLFWLLLGAALGRAEASRREVLNSDTGYGNRTSAIVNSPFPIT